MRKSRNLLVSSFAGLVGLISVSSTSFGQEITPQDLSKVMISEQKYSSYELMDRRGKSNIQTGFMDLKNKDCEAEIRTTKYTLENEKRTDDLTYRISCNSDKGISEIYFVDNDSNGFGDKDFLRIFYRYPDGKQFKIQADRSTGEYSIHSCVRNNSGKEFCGFAKESDVPWFLRWKAREIIREATDAFSSLYKEFIQDAYNRKLQKISTNLINEASGEIKPIVDKVLNEENEDAIKIAIELAKKLELY